MIQNKNNDIKQCVDLSGLPHKGKNNQFVDWKNSAGYSIPFMYDNVCGEIQIIGYDNGNKCGYSNPHIIIMIENYVQQPLRISTSVIRNGLLYNLVGSKIINSDKDMVKYLVNKSDAYTVAYGSKKLIKMKCPICGTIYDKMPNTVHTYGFSCSVCGDGYSVPNKLMRNILTQLQIDFIPEVNKKHFSWIGKYKYDFYVLINDENILIEMDGGYHKWQHDIDKIKSDLAIRNHFKLIRIDCDYNGNPLIYIKNNLINSELNNILNLSMVDWGQCRIAMVDSEVRYACQLWEEEAYGTTEIANAIGKDRHTVVSYLRRGFDIGLCPSFSNKESIFRGNNPYIMVLRKGNSVGVFRHVHQLCDVSIDLFGEKFHLSSVRACYDKKQKYKGFNIRRITREEYLQYKMIENKNNEVVSKEEIAV